MTHKTTSSSRRKQRKAHFQAASNDRRKIMGTHLSKDLKQKYDVQSMAIRRDDEVKVMSGSLKGHIGKVIQVYRNKWCIFVDKLTKVKSNGANVQIPIDPSNCVVTKLKVDKDRNSLLNCKRRAKGGVGKGEKYQREDLRADVD